MIAWVIVLLILFALIFLYLLAFKKKFSKFALIVCIVCVGVMVINNQFSKSDPARAQVQQYQKIAPPVEYALIVVQTSSRIYYVNHYKDDGKICTLLDYYTFGKKNWEYSDKPIVIDRNIYGEIRIYRRQ
jgi:hypothetical protein